MRKGVRRWKVLYKEIPSYINKIDKILKQEGVGFGEKFLVWGTNSYEYALLLLTALSTGRVAIPVDFRNKPETIKMILQNTRPKLAIVSSFLNSAFIKDELTNILTFEKLTEKLLETLKQDSNPGTKESFKNPENICEIVFTSGTTGVPKGVIIKQKNITSNLQAITHRLQSINSDTTISILPLSHMFEQIVGLLLPLSLGAKIIYLQKINSFRMLSAFKEYKPSHLIFVPQMLKIMWQKFEVKAHEKNKFNQFKFALEHADLIPLPIKRFVFGDIFKLFGGKIKYLACGGAPLEEEVARNFKRVGIPVIEGYGATEVTAVATINPLNKVKPGSAGTPIENVEITFSDDKEIIIQSPSISEGYFNNEAATNKVFTKGGYVTGDIGEMDKEGYIHIIGRSAFKIVLPSGEKVFVEDLERKLFTDKRIKDACCIGIKEQNGDKIFAYVILKEGIKATLDSIFKDVNQKLESKQQITSYDIWPSNDFPRTPTLKIDRKKVFEFANSKDKTHEPEELANTEIKTLDQILSSVIGKPAFQISDSHILAQDLKVSSLARTEIIAMIEEYLGKVVDEAKINEQTTVSELKSYINEAETIGDVDFATWHFTWLGQLLHRLVTRSLLFPVHSNIIKINYPQKEFPKIKPGSIIICNHPGMLDAVCTLRTAFKLGITKVVTNSYENNWVPRDILTFAIELFFGGLPMYLSGHKFEAVLRKNSDLLDNGYTMLLFPQGRMEPFEQIEEDGFRPGTGHFIKLLQRPVYIMKIIGYKKIWPLPRGGWEGVPFTNLLPPRRGSVQILISDEIKYDTSLNTEELSKKVEEDYKNFAKEYFTDRP